jgi:hypothetical protein
MKEDIRHKIYDLFKRNKPPSCEQKPFIPSMFTLIDATNGEERPLGIGEELVIYEVSQHRFVKIRINDPEVNGGICADVTVGEDRYNKEMFRWNPIAQDVNKRMNINVYFSKDPCYIPLLDDGTVIMDISNNTIMAPDYRIKGPNCKLKNGILRVAQKRDVSGLFYR